jgi:hypothetical protein
LRASGYQHERPITAIGMERGFLFMKTPKHFQCLQ